MTMNADKGNEDIFKHVIVEKNLMHDGSPSIDLFNLDYFRERIALLMASYIYFNVAISTRFRINNRVSPVVLTLINNISFYPVVSNFRNHFQNHFSFMP